MVIVLMPDCSALSVNPWLSRVGVAVSNRPCWEHLDSTSSSVPASRTLGLARRSWRGRSANVHGVTNLLSVMVLVTVM